jgi:hypothetical protein
MDFLLSPVSHCLHVNISHVNFQQQQNYGQHISNDIVTPTPGVVNLLRTPYMHITRKNGRVAVSSCEVVSSNGIHDPYGNRPFLTQPPTGPFGAHRTASQARIKRPG